MTQFIQAHNLELYEVKERFNLQSSNDQQAFPEWQIPAPSLTAHEHYWLDQAKANFLSLADYPLHEEIVKMTVLAPVLSVAGLCRAPFVPAAEYQVAVSFADSDEVMRGRVDLLVLHRQLWVAAIETKPKQSDVLTALPQALFYMMASQPDAQTMFGLITNGNHFLFIKLIKQPQPVYVLSELFTLFRQANDLYQVVGILRHLKQIVLQHDWQTQQAG
jgi:hypothetical protein